MNFPFNLATYTLTAKQLRYCWRWAVT